MRRKQSAVFLALAISSPGFAASTGPCSARDAPFDSLSGLVCDLEEMSKSCLDWFKANPDTAQFSRDCRSATEAPQPGGLATAWRDFSNCAGAFGDAWSWSYRRLKSNAEFDAFCAADRSFRCKIDLAISANLLRSADIALDSLGHPVLSASQKELLRDWSASALIRKRRDVRELAKRDPAYRAA